MALIRKRRAAPQDIYPACKVSNTCPADILNKMEQNTLADKILKYGSAGVFLGGLGISTGKGVGGRTGYIPLGGTESGVGVGTRVTTIRPTVPISSVGSPDFIPVDAVDPLGPAVIPPERFPIAVEDPFTLPPPRFPTAVEEDVIELQPIPGPSSEIPLAGPKITTDAQPAILEVIPETRPPKVITRHQYSNPAFEVSITSNSGAGESSASDHVLVEGFSGGHSIGEHIPLQDLAPSRPSFSETIEDETAFSSSTPKQGSRSERPKSYYNRRRYQQVQVTDPVFISRPRSLVTFDNPAFDESVDLIFERDVAEITAAPHADFTDITKLTKPAYHRGPSGHVRVSRLGHRANIKTRSGLTIGPQSHFYYDVSSIDPAESFELQALGNVSSAEQTGEAVISSGTGDFEIISLEDSILESYNDEDLIDVFEDVARDLHLLVGERRQQPIQVQRYIKPFSFVNEGVHIIHPGSESDFWLPPVTPDSTPAIVIDILDSSADYYLHPSLIKKRKRKHFFF
ncbi:late protein 2 [Lambdapapillomavirus 2]|uniref:Minor capsid protein L2 n=1 Tax=Canine oral papillomavirus (strain Y62) TaxID=766192 RepID=VL2_COPV6|nr:late protein 2 [Lambdapapillomavirus 2]Q89892.1 RecName: Full=Minor capsid protein L2 [Canine oral papillomavirus (strain Y62)]AAA61749.1 minor capsid protein [Lambdapapillomavirus 2]AEQ61647.1 L2 [synthetic construct]BAA09502.1 late protein [Lambdapapillomavirus 2]